MGQQKCLRTLTPCVCFAANRRPEATTTTTTFFFFFFFSKNIYQAITPLASQLKFTERTHCSRDFSFFFFFFFFYYYEGTVFGVRSYRWKPSISRNFVEVVHYFPDVGSFLSVRAQVEGALETSNYHILELLRGQFKDTRRK